MASKKVQASTTVVIPVELKTKAEDFKQIAEAAEKALGSIRVGSGESKRIASQLRNAQLAQSRYESAVSGTSATAKEFTQINKFANQFGQAIERIALEFQHINTSSLNLTPTELDSWKKAQDKVKDYAKAVNDAKSGVATVSQLFDTNAMQKFSKSGVKSTMQLGDAVKQAEAYYDAMKQKQVAATASVKTATKEYKNLQKATQDANDAVTQAKQDVRIAQGEKAAVDQRTARSYQQEALTRVLAGPTTDKKTAGAKIFSALASAQSSTSRLGDKTQTVFDSIFDNFFTKPNKNGTRALRGGVKDQVSYYLQALGLSDKTVSSILANATTRVDKIKEAIAAALRATPVESYEQQALNNALSLAKAESARKADIAAADKNIGQKQAALLVAENNARIAGAKEQAGADAVTKAKDAEKNATEEVTLSGKVYNELLNTQNNMQLQIDRLTTELDNAQQQLEQLEQQLKQVHASSGAGLDTQVKPGVKSVERETDNLKGQIRAGEEENAAMKEAEAETQQFQANMQATIKRWFGFQQIVNVVRGGIQKAYQDIQNLDKAMTNIAVVTSMSVEDLWGKIDQYMSIAQQYGVTTKGVYEVSQLFYQQGLGTADVLELTTETLKMARQ